MRKLTMLGVAAAIVAGVALTSGPSQAITLGAPAAVNGAAETLNLVDKAACWRYGWHGWGWYPCYVGPRYYGWGYRRWGWHGYGWRRHWW